MKNLNGFKRYKVTFELTLYKQASMFDLTDKFLEKIKNIKGCNQSEIRSQRFFITLAFVSDNIEQVLVEITTAFSFFHIVETVDAVSVLECHNAEYIPLLTKKIKETSHA